MLVLTYICIYVSHLTTFLFLNISLYVKYRFVFHKSLLFIPNSYEQKEHK